eukprot:TRINITY_DN65301_c0_g1_i1.p1 TRINITY_DN65301_c0_g1~~TRINITY_DN65301_c0_g1_i1.p1  ORF type:complete len:1682 (+),score=427.74 TRINITY_DN65301_c0_g1_i1:83-5128(+)
MAPAAGDTAAVAVGVSLEAFGSFACGLHELLGSLDLVSQALSKLLDCSSQILLDGAKVADWCLDEQALSSHSPAAVARLLLLERLVQRGGREEGVGQLDEAEKGRLLEQSPSILSDGPEAVARTLASTISKAVGSSAAAVEWLRPLRSREDASYVRAAGPLVSRYRGPTAAALREEAWDFAVASMTGGGASASSRGACQRQLLPVLVDASCEVEERSCVAARLSEMVKGLVGTGGRSELLDALELAVAFNDLLIPHWKLDSVSEPPDEIGVVLVTLGLRSGKKEQASGRKNGRFLIQAAAQRALSNPSSNSWLLKTGSTAKEVNAVWRSLWNLFESLEEFGSHLLKASWASSVDQIIRFLKWFVEQKLSIEGLPAWVPSSYWLEVLMTRAMSHDNDNVAKYVIVQLIGLDQTTIRLSESFVLGELLPRLTHNVESLYPKSDVSCAFEKQVAAFFAAYAACHAEGAAVAAHRLLTATMDLRMMHHMPLRLLFNAMCNVVAPGALDAMMSCSMMEQFFLVRLRKMPQSSRCPLAELFLRLVGAWTRVAPEAVRHEVALRLVKATAAIPDVIFLKLETHLAAFAAAALGTEASALLLQLLKGAAGGHAANTAPAGLPPAEALGNTVSPMEAAQLALGIGRLVHVLASPGAEDRERADDRIATILSVVEPTLADVHRRPYLPRRAVVASLYAVSYTSALQNDGSRALRKALDSKQEAAVEVLGFVASRASLLLQPDNQSAVRQEMQWAWLYAFVLEQWWHPGLPQGEDIARLAGAVLEKLPQNASPGEAQILSGICAAVFLGALAPRMPARRAWGFRLLFEAHARKPPGISDDQFQIVDVDGLGEWSRPRTEEHEELSRVEHEGLARILTWRDAMGVFFVAKWRALAALACGTGDGTADEAFRKELADAASSQEGAGPGSFALRILDELDSVQSPYSGHWAIVARRLAYPLLFKVCADEEAELQRLSTGLCGAIAEHFGEGSAFIPQGTLAELAAALCDPYLLDAERRLYSNVEPAKRPVARAVLKLLQVGEASVGVSRAVAVPLLGALLAGKDMAASQQEAALITAAELLTTLLLHREAVIEDGAACHSPNLVEAALDSTGPGGGNALRALVPNADKLMSKFKSTPGMPRVLTLAALAALVDRKDAPPGEKLPAVALATMQALLKKMQDTLKGILNPPGAKPTENRTPTPMPFSPTHRIQVRGWQALMVIGQHADAETATQMLPEVFWHLGTPHLPDVREYQELLCCMLCTKAEAEAVTKHLVPALQKFEDNVQVCASFLMVSAYLFRSWGRGAGKHASSSPLEPHVTALVLAVAPYLSHNSAYVRGTAAWGYFHVIHGLGRETVTEALGPQAGLALSFFDFLANHKECIKMRGRTSPVFERFEPLERAGVESLLQLSHVKPSVEEQEEGDSSPSYVFLDGDFRPTQTFVDVVKQEAAHVMEVLWDRSDSTINPAVSDEWHYFLERLAKAERERQEAEASRATTEATTAYPSQTAFGGVQRKFVPDAPVADAPRSEALVRRVRQPLMVVASLVDKTPNLAGLCRTSEVFNCESLWLPNLKITKDQGFQSMTVTAEKWMPLKDVPPEKLVEQLKEFRRRGYELVGVEQTHNSVPLDEWRFAEGGTVLVLGAEKEGICAEVLPLLDGCVEIPQAGQIRSLNVHVSGSLAIWEYTKQRRDRAKLGVL